MAAHTTLSHGLSIFYIPSAPSTPTSGMTAVDQSKTCIAFASADWAEGGTPITIACCRCPHAASASASAQSTGSIEVVVTVTFTAVIIRSIPSFLHGSTHNSHMRIAVSGSCWNVTIPTASCCNVIIPTAAFSTLQLHLSSCIFRLQMPVCAATLLYPLQCAGCS